MGVSAKLLAGGLAGAAVLLVPACGSGAGNSPGAGSGGGSKASSGGASSGGAASRHEPGETALVTSMQQSVRSATSVHVTGRLVNAGVLVAISLDLRRNGDLAGTVSQNGAPFQVVGVGGKVFIKATPAFLRQVKAPANACAAVCGKWIRLQRRDASRIAGDIGMASMTGQLVTTKLPKFTEAGSATVAGQSAWVLRSPHGGTLDLSSTGSPYPLAAVTATNPRQEISYSRWNAVPPPTAPPANEVLNLKGIG